MDNSLGYFEKVRVNGKTYKLAQVFFTPDQKESLSFYQIFCKDGSDLFIWSNELESISMTNRLTVFQYHNWIL